MLLSPSFRQCVAVIAVYAVIVALAVWAASFRTEINEFQPINPVAHPRTWLISLATLLLGAFQQEIWGRALLQSTLERSFGNRWIALGLSAVLLAAVDQSGHRGLFTFGLAVLLGVVYMRTRSLLCTTGIHVVVDLSQDMLRGGVFMAEGLFAHEGFLDVKLLLLPALLLLAFAVELQHRPGPDRFRPIKALATALALIALAIAIGSVTGHLLRPVWQALVDHNEWLTRRTVGYVDALTQAGVAVLVFSWLGVIPSLRELFAIRPRNTLCLMLLGAALPALTAFVALPAEFSSGLFAPLGVMSPHFWLGGVMPLLAASLQEELFYRALFQTLLSRLFRNEWAGLVASALLFTASHQPVQTIFVFPAGLLFGIVFMRTRSIVCTTALHLVMNVSLGMITGTSLTLSLFIPSDVFAPARPLLGAFTFALAVAFEWSWRRSAEARAHRLASPPNERIAPVVSAPTSV